MNKKLPSIELLLKMVRFLGYSKNKEDLFDSIKIAKRIKTFTRKLWCQNHKEILLELNSLTDRHTAKQLANLNRGFWTTDYQILWHECLKFPYRFPIKRNIHGFPNVEHDLFGLPSDFNKNDFFKAIISNIKHDKNLTIKIQPFLEDQDYFREINLDCLIFDEAEILAVTVGNSKNGFQTLDSNEIPFKRAKVYFLAEIPALKWFKEYFGLKSDYSKLIEKRLFALRSVTLDTDNKDNVNVLFFNCKSWKSKVLKEERDLPVHIQNVLKTENLEYYSLNDFSSWPTGKLTFLILDQGYQKGFPEIHIECSSENLAVKLIKGQEESLLFNLMPEAHTSIFRMLKMLTWGQTEFPSEERNGKGRVMLTINGSEVVVGITFSIRVTSSGEVGIVKFVDKF